MALVALCALAAGSASALDLEVQVSGLNEQLEDNVLALLDIYQERGNDDLTEDRLLALHRKAPKQIRAALAPFGHYRVEVEDDLTRSGPKDAKAHWRASYRIAAGKPIRITRVDYRITGPGADNKAFPQPFPLKAGDVLLHQQWESAKSDLRYTAATQGYLDFDVPLHQVLIDPLDYGALVHYHLDTGPQYRIGPIAFKQDLLADSLLRRYITHHEGDIYDPAVLLALQGRLLGTEYYSDVEIVPRRDALSADGRLPVDVVAKRNKANKFRFGLGYATDVGPRISAEWKRRYLNRWGHKFTTKLRLSPALSEWNLDYRAPVANPVQDYVQVQPRITRYDTDSRSGWVYGVRGAYSTLGANGWRRNIGLDYTYEDLKTSDGADNRFSSLVPSISWSKTVADDPINTNRGYRLNFSLLGAAEGVLSDSSFLGGTASAKWVRRFANDYRFITRGDLGAIWAAHLEDVPVSRRFYAGGDSSIRGWGYDVLGPSKAHSNEVIGGRYLAVGSLELERRIKGPWSAAVFSDFGNAFDSGDSPGIAYSLGFGVRWSSPIGQVRVDLAFPMTKDHVSGGMPPMRLHIVVGPDL